MSEIKTKKSKRDEFIKVFDEADGTGKEKIILLAEQLLNAQILMKREHTQPPKRKILQSL